MKNTQEDKYCCYSGRSLRAQYVTMPRPLSSYRGQSWSLTLTWPSTRTFCWEGRWEVHKAHISLAFHITIPTHPKLSAPDFGLNSYVCLRLKHKAEQAAGWEEHTRLPSNDDHVCDVPQTMFSIQYPELTVDPESTQPARPCVHSHLLRTFPSTAIKLVCQRVANAKLGRLQGQKGK